MNICEIQKVIEQNTSDINSIKNNNNTSCDCAYQVIIKSGAVGNTPVFEVIKGDYATAKNKIENGEYVDFVLYDSRRLSDGAYDEDGDEGYLEQAILTASVLACSSFIKIKLDGNYPNLYWTADGVSITRPENSGTDNPGTGGDSGDGGEINK